MLRSLLVLFAIAALAAGHVFDDIGKGIADLTGEIHQFEQHISDHVHLFKSLKRNWIHIKDSLDKLQGSGCDDQFQMQCGGDKPTCISRLLICDKVSDCPNGLDESQCDAMTPVGSEWKGTFTYDFCTRRKPTELTMHVHKYNIPIELLSFPEVEAHAMMADKTSTFSYSTAFILHGVMDIKPGVHLLYFNPPESDGLALQCIFDGVNDDHCHGEIIHELTGDACAEFFMERVMDPAEGHDYYHDH